MYLSAVNQHARLFKSYRGVVKNESSSKFGWHINKLRMILKTRPNNRNAMKYKQTKGNEIQGELDIFISHNENENDGVVSSWDEVLIHGNPEGLKSFAKLLFEIAELKEEDLEDKYLPIGAREHYHLRPGIELSKSSIEVIVGRLDAKGTGDFYKSFIPKDKN